MQAEASGKEEGAPDEGTKEDAEEDQEDGEEEDDVAEDDEGEWKGRKVVRTFFFRRLTNYVFPRNAPQGAGGRVARRECRPVRFVLDSSQQSTTRFAYVLATLRSSDLPTEKQLKKKHASAKRDAEEKAKFEERERVVCLSENLDY